MPTDSLASLRALLARVPEGCTRGPWGWYLGVGAEHYELCADRGPYPGLRICDHGARQEDLDAAALAPDLVDALRWAEGEIEKLSEDPPSSRHLCDCTALAEARAEVASLTAALDTAHRQGAEEERGRVVAFGRRRSALLCASRHSIQQAEELDGMLDDIECGSHLEAP